MKGNQVQMTNKKTNPIDSVKPQPSNIPRIDMKNKVLEHESQSQNQKNKNKMKSPSNFSKSWLL